MEWGEVIVAAAGVITVAVGAAWGVLKGFVKQTEAKWDDKLVEAVEKGIARKEAKDRLQGGNGE
jgi:hypothetical protein